MYLKIYGYLENSFFLLVFFYGFDRSFCVLEICSWSFPNGDVFRAPINSGLLCVYIGTGVQDFGMTVVTIIFALLGFLSPSNRGGLMTAMVLLWVFMGLFSGYSLARLYKMFKGTEWKRNTLKTAFMFPGILFAVFLF